MRRAGQYVLAAVSAVAIVVGLLGLTVYDVIVAEVDRATSDEEAL